MKPGPRPEEPKHGSLYAYNRRKCRCPKCSAARRAYDQSRGRAQGIRDGPRRREARTHWYVCARDGRRHRNHDYLAGQCARCDARQAVEEYWQRKWEESKP